MIVICALLTCHNRIEKTTLCLQSLLKQDGLNSIFCIKIYMVDDGSNDGTTTTLRQSVPDISIITGNGNLFWNLGMNTAWKAAEEDDGSCDYFLWLNNDTFLYPGAVENMLSATAADNMSIICGSTQSAITNEITYGGFDRKTDSLLVPNGLRQSCDFFNGNCVLIPYLVFKRLGYLDVRFHHAIGDFDYGLRAAKKGVSCFIAPTFVGTCEGHLEDAIFFNPSVPFFKRIKSLYQSSCTCHPIQRFIFEHEHRGWLISIFHFFTIHIRVLAPSLWKIKPYLYSKRGNL